MKGTLSPVVIVGMLLLTGGTWWWRVQVAHTQPPPMKGDSWAHVKQGYPLPEPIALSIKLSPEFVEPILHANPFSPTRHPPASASGGDTEIGGGLIESPKPKFVFKGRINLGQRHRAIVEDSTTHKTYFLEVGQEVTGFKVLDISENQVVLSDVTTNEAIVLSLMLPASAAPRAQPPGSGETGGR